MKSIVDNPEGLHQRYIIRKITGIKTDGYNSRFKTKAIDKGAEYFVLRLDLGGSDLNHVLACRKAIHLYANEIEATIPKLAQDLRERYPIEPLENLLKPEQKQ